MKEFSFRTYAQQTFNLIYIAFLWLFSNMQILLIDTNAIKDGKEHNTKPTTLLVTIHLHIVFTNANMNIVSRSTANDK